MTFSVLVCDDLAEERSNLIRMLRSYELEHDVELQIETAADGAELLSLWRPDRWDIIFLDIYMPEMNGAEAARRLRQVDRKCEIVFATTSREHGMDGYDLHAMDYLTKPFTQKDIDSALEWFFQLRAKKHCELTVRTEWGEQTVPAEEIRYIESRGHSCIIHAQGQELSIRGNLKELCDKLGETDFFRCHQSFLVNFAHVQDVEKKGFLLDNGDWVPISAANLSRSRAAFMEWSAAQD